MKKIKVINQEDFKKRLDVFIIQISENKYPRSLVAISIEKGFVLVNKKNQKSSYKIKPDDVIEIDENEIQKLLNPSLELKKWDFKLDIVYEDDDLIVVNKPKNMLTHPTKYDREYTLCNALLNHCSLSDIGGNDRLGIVHRLDKNTSGLIICAKNNNAHKILSEQIKNKEAKRKYLAIALGEFKDDEGVINKALLHYIKNDVKMTIAPDNKGLEAITLYKVVERYKGATLLELELKTGRTHQIRAHLASIQHPVFGDSLYGARSFMRKEFYNLKTVEQLLQSYYICFKHPSNGKKMEFQLDEKDFSEDFIKVLSFLRRTNEH